MLRRNHIYAALGGAALAVLLIGSSLLLEQPLSVPDGSKPFSHSRQREFSDPAIAGMRHFNDVCSECHGMQAEGTETAPGLLHRSYAEDFRDSEKFHSALGRQIPAHQDLIRERAVAETLDFNRLERLAKFLREARRSKAL